MALVVIGINFQSAPLAIREQLHFREDVLESAYQNLKKRAAGSDLLDKQNPVQAAIILSTCNRMEFYTYGDKIQELIASSTAFIANFHKLSEKTLRPYLYRMHGAIAVLHLFQVAAGLKSMVLGENQILAQLKKAYRSAQQYHFISGELSRAFEQALAAGKRVRHKTGINRGGSSIGSVALDFIKELYGKNAHLKTLLIGAGDIAKEVLRSLVHHNNLELTLTNRNLAKAEALAKQFQASTIPLTDRYRAITTSDIVISSVEMDSYIIELAKLRQAIKGSAKPIIFIDLSVPRSLDPNIGNIEDVIVYTIDDFQDVIKRTTTKRKQEIQKALEIINTLEEEFYLWETKRSFIRFLKSVHDSIDSKVLNEKITRFQKYLRDTRSSKNSSLDQDDKLIDIFLKQHLPSQQPDQGEDPEEGAAP